MRRAARLGQLGRSTGVHRTPSTHASASARRDVAGSTPRRPRRRGGGTTTTTRTCTCTRAASTGTASPFWGACPALRASLRAQAPVHVASVVVVVAVIVRVVLVAALRVGAVGNVAIHIVVVANIIVGVRHFSVVVGPVVGAARRIVPVPVRILIAAAVAAAPAPAVGVPPPGALPLLLLLRLTNQLSQPRRPAKDLDIPQGNHVVNDVVVRGEARRDGVERAVINSPVGSRGGRSVPGRVEHVLGPVGHHRRRPSCRCPRVGRQNGQQGARFHLKSGRSSPSSFSLPWFSNRRFPAAPPATATATVGVTTPAAIGS